MEKRKNRSYSKDFKMKIVQLLNAKQEPARAIIKKYKLGTSMVYKWKALFGSQVIPADIGTHNVKKDIKTCLRERIFKAEQELESLKIALTVISKMEAPK